MTDFQDDADVDVNPYANNVFGYERIDEGDANYPEVDNVDTRYRVISEVASADGCSTCANGLGEYKYEHEVLEQYYLPHSGSGYDLNRPHALFTEYLPDTTPGDWTDNDQVLAYINPAGQKLATVEIEKKGTSSFADDVRTITYYEYDERGRLVIIAHPGSVNGISWNLADTVVSSDEFNGTGFVERFEYASSTTSGTVSGDVTGMLKARYVRNGYFGEDIPVASWEYYKHTDGVTGAFTYPVAKEVSYWDLDRDQVDDAVETGFSYTWHLDSGGTVSTSRIESVTVTNPTVSTTRNGSGSATSSTTYFDYLGRETWRKDEDGFLFYTAYDNQTGAVAKSIADVDTAQTGTFAGKPTNWSTSGGLHLTNTMTVDKVGNPTKLVDAEGNQTFWVYDYGNRMVKQYHSGPGSFSQVGPVYVAREYWPVESATSGQRTVYTESLVSSATPNLTSGVPNGTETIGIADIEKLSREITNNAGQVTQVEKYFDLTGLSYTVATPSLGSSGTNFYRTLLDYDGRGRLKRVENAVGTIHRYLYNGQSRLTQQWTGTDDSPTSGNWSPSNTSGTDLTLVLQNRYGDQRGGLDAPAAPTLSTVAGGSLPARTYYVKITYITAEGETFGSAESSISVPSGQLLKVAAPSAVPGADGYHVYVSAVSGTHTREGSYLNLGEDWTQGPFGLTNEPPPPWSLNPGSGSGELSATITHPTGSTSASTDRAVTYHRDWRNRIVAVKTGARLDSSFKNDVANESSDVQRMIDTFDYDNIGHVVSASTFDGDGVLIGSTGGVPDKPNSALMRAQTDTFYDDWGRTYKSSTYSVDASSGAASPDTLDSLIWYSNRGYAIKAESSGGIVNKNTFNSVGWITASYATDGGGDTGWSDADDVTGDKVLEQAAYQHDDSGNVLLTTSKLRFHDETGTGALADAGTSPKARVYYSTGYYDALDRLTHSVNVGTNPVSGVPTVYTRPGTVPSRSDEALVTSHSYDSAGNLQDVTDPRGNVTRSAYNLLGQLTGVTEAYTDGTPSDADDRITRYTYNGIGNVLTMTADLAGTDQTTQYVYGVTIGSGNVLASNDLLKEIRYPDASTGLAGTATSDKVQYAYNALGETIKKTDKNGNVNEYGYDVLGRFLTDSVTTLGSGVDGAVRRLATTYNTQGLPERFTSYDAASGGDEVNEVQRIYNGLGQIVTEYQDHADVATGSSPKVEYDYSEMASGVNHSRLTAMTYPNGRALRYEYDSGLDSDIGRISFLADDSGGSVGTHLEEYSYLGLDKIVRKNRPEPGVELTYIKQGVEGNGDAGDKYAGLDRLGRIADQRWLVTSGGSQTDRWTFAYDRNSNPLYKTNELSASMSELYHANSSTSGDNNTAYDKLNRLKDFRRGTLTSSGNNGSGWDTVSTASRIQNWDLDALGNSDSVTSDGTPQSRTHNSKNQATVVGGNNLAFDNAGNTKTDESGKQHVYDAWNRLVESKASIGAGGASLVTHAYDALNRRIIEAPNGGTATDSYYAASWQVIEERQSAVTKAQYVWGIGYIDDLVLRDKDADNNSGTGSLGKASSGLEQRLYAQQDANHNITALVNTSGTVVQRFVYDPYGVATVLDAGWSGTSDAYNWHYRHQGTRWEANAGLYDTRNRFYSPTLMRWMQEDPEGYVDGANLFLSYNATPIGVVDPSGLVARDENGMITVVTFRKPDPNIDTYTAIDPETGKEFKYVAGTVSITADDGTEVLAKKNAGKSDPRVDYNCHGFSVADSSFWINPEQFEKILRGDGYERVDKPQAGDIVVYRDVRGRAAHSGIVDKTGEDESKTQVKSKSGYEKAPTIKPAKPGKGGAWSDESTKIEYYRKPKTEEKQNCRT